MDIKKTIANSIIKEVNFLSVDEIEKILEVPKNKEMGDYALPCFRFAKELKKAPNLIAADLAEKIEGEIFENIVATGGYLNFKLQSNFFTNKLFTDLKEMGENYGNSDMGKGETVIVEFSSANIAKPFHIGHLRSTMIGNSLYRIYKALGYHAVAINHLGDYGTQFGKLISAYKRWGNKSEIEKDPINNFLQLYIKFHEEAEKDESLNDEARAYFKALEEGEQEAYELWSWIRELSLQEFMRVYKELDVSFDSYNGEAFYSDKMDEVLEILREKEIVKKDGTAEIVDLSDYDMPNALITKSDGSTLYITRDLAAAIYRIREYNFTKNIYVVAYQQDLHFKQWFKILDMMGFEKAKDCEHVNFGMISLEEGTLSTRKGRVVTLESVLNKAREMALKIIDEKNPDLENKEETAKMIGYGAIVFQDLFNQRVKDYTFSWDKALSFEGESAPYVQYVHARCNTLIEKSGINPSYEELKLDVLNDEHSQNLIKCLLDFPQTIINAMQANEPSKITRYSVDLAGAFNKFYQENQINVEDMEVKKARIALTKAVRDVIKKSLYLIGVKAPLKM